MQEAKRRNETPGGLDLSTRARRAQPAGTWHSTAGRIAAGQRAQAHAAGQRVPRLRTHGLRHGSVHVGETLHRLGEVGDGLIGIAVL